MPWEFKKIPWNFQHESLITLILIKKYSIIGTNWAFSTVPVEEARANFQVRANWMIDKWSERADAAFSRGYVTNRLLTRVTNWHFFLIRRSIEIQRAYVIHDFVSPAIICCDIWWKKSLPVSLIYYLSREFYIPLHRMLPNW